MSCCTTVSASLTAHTELPLPCCAGTENGGLLGLGKGAAAHSSSTPAAQAAQEASEPALALRTSGARKWGPAQFSPTAAPAASQPAAAPAAHTGEAGKHAQPHCKCPPYCTSCYSAP